MKQLLSLSIIFTVVISTWCCGNTPFHTDNNSDSVQQTIVFISDTQVPMWFEKIFVKTHRNEEATKILLNAIACDSSVSSVFMLGDITAMSSLNSNWVIIDSFLTRLKVCQIHAYATAGNHDYLISPSAGEANLKK